MNTPFYKCQTSLKLCFCSIYTFGNVATHILIIDYLTCWVYTLNMMNIYTIINICVVIVSVNVLASMRKTKLTKYLMVIHFQIEIADL